MNLRKNKTTKILIIVFAIALLIEIGYAVLSSTLKINGNTKINQARWDVHFANVQVTDGSVTTEKPATIAADTTTVNYEVTLTKPGDFYEFTVDAVNGGTIDAMVSTIENTPLTEAQQKYLKYTVKYSSGAEVAEKQLLVCNKTETLKVKVEFKKDVQASDLPTTAETLTLTFNVDYAQADSTAVAINHPTCIRATKLHTEICNQDSNYNYCGKEYSQGDTVTYGSLGTEGAVIEAGDAFDCDANGDGKYDEATERFYYVSDLDTNADYAVLVYYSNVAAGVSNNTETFAYDSDRTPKTNGPKTAIEQLPTTEQWKKVSLSATTRAIKDETGTTHIANFSYAGKAARLLTYQEVVSACGSKYYLDNSCQYLMENTDYTTPSLFGIGYMLENVDSEDNSSFTIMSMSCGIGSGNGRGGIRPVIEVPKSKIAS